jgi:hypothetical protein
MGLPDDDMQQLISSITCCIPEQACPPQLAAVCVGSITCSNKDWCSKVDGKITHFYVQHEIDDEEATHVLEISMYAYSSGSAAAAEPNQWALLEQLPTTAAS